MKELNDVDILFLKSITDTVPEGEEHKFSLRYKLRKKQIIRKWEQKQNCYVYKRPSIRLKYILIAILIACIAALAGFGLFDFFEGFRVTDYDIYSMLYVVDDLSVYPDTIEKKFYIDMDMSKYDIEVKNDFCYEYWINLIKDDTLISIKQATMDYESSLRLDAENLNIKPIPIKINNWNGIYYKTDECNCYILNTGEYIVTYNGNFDKNEIENIVKATKFQ